MEVTFLSTVSYTDDQSITHNYTPFSAVSQSAVGLTKTYELCSITSLTLPGVLNHGIVTS